MDKLNFNGFELTGNLAWFICGAGIALLAVGEFPLALGAAGVASLVSALDKGDSK